MLPKLTHHPVNWVDGMKMVRRHFTEFEQFVSDHLRDAVAGGLTSYNYGLLASDLPDFSVQIITDPSHNIRVQLTNCRAVTGAGCRIEVVNPPRPIELATSLSTILTDFQMPTADEMQFLVILSVDLFNRQPTGQPVAEAFPRPPFSLPTYALSIVPRHQYNGPAGQRSPYQSHDFEALHLVVGQIDYKLGLLTPNDQYIPACRTVNAHSRLRAWADSVQKLLSEVQRDCFLIVRKVCEKRGTEDARKAGALAELIRDLCEQLATGLNDVLNQFGFRAHEQPPIVLLEAITLVTRHFQTALMNLNSPATTGSVRMGDQLVLKYFQDWTDISPERLTRQGLERVITHSYNHTDIRPHLQLITQCWTDIGRIMNELSKLDYIGQERKDRTVIVTSDRTNRDNLPNLPGTGLLDETSAATVRRKLTGY